MKFFLLPILFTSLHFVYSQKINPEISKKTIQFGKEVLKIIKRNSLYSDSLNWNKISSELAALPTGKNDSVDHETIFDFFTRKLREIGDNHSLFFTRASMSDYRFNHSEPEEPEGKYLGNGIGLIRVPKCWRFDSKKDRDFANTIRSHVKKIDTENDVIGWVVDLRNNGGGNMWPMIAGLNALLKDGTIGYIVGTPNNKEIEWKSENGKINFSRELIDTYKAKNLNNKIAVLIDSMTGSSGELTAISLIGLPNVKTFGQPSAGYTTTNKTFTLSDGTQLFLATNFVADRTHKSYPTRITPDVIVNISNDFGKDQTLEYSKKWILQTDNK